MDILHKIEDAIEVLDPNTEFYVNVLHRAQILFTIHNTITTTRVRVEQLMGRALNAIRSEEPEKSKVWSELMDEIKTLIIEAGFD
ncbi:hypothetical protein BG011_009923 [Mortierella polycephala]|uniref:Uncharacterized protein n=1 Tax=Mortierella polycephala TaxID=41804 RepID=A0A9P6PMK9_9FUNG|nr:hypothetical protein BG011_009923 [Mortierella polycephala]